MRIRGILGILVFAASFLIAEKANAYLSKEECKKNCLNAPCSQAGSEWRCGFLRSEGSGNVAPSKAVKDQVETKAAPATTSKSVN
jgi:hypothetical protein